MREIPNYKIEAIRMLIEPERGEISAEHLRKALSTLGKRPITITELAKTYGMTPDGIRKRLARHGVVPIRKGIGTAPSLYDPTEVAAAIIER